MTELITPELKTPLNVTQQNLKIEIGQTFLRCRGKVIR